MDELAQIETDTWDTPPHQPYGELTSICSVTCANPQDFEGCVTWDQVLELGRMTKTRAMRDLRTMGWTLTKEYGWMCPECRKR